MRKLTTESGRDIHKNFMLQASLRDAEAGDDSDASAILGIVVTNSHVLSSEAAHAGGLQPTAQELTTFQCLKPEKKTIQNKR